MENQTRRLKWSSPDQRGDIDILITLGIISCAVKSLKWPNYFVVNWSDWSYKVGVALWPNTKSTVLRSTCVCIVAHTPVLWWLVTYRIYGLYLIYMYYLYSSCHFITQFLKTEIDTVVMSLFVSEYNFIMNSVSGRKTKYWTL